MGGHTRRTFDVMEKMERKGPVDRSKGSNPGVDILPSVCIMRSIGKPISNPRRPYQPAAPSSDKPSTAKRPRMERIP